MTKAKILKIAGILSGIFADVWTALSVKAGIRPFRPIRVIGQADGPTAIYVAMRPKGKAGQAIFGLTRAMPVILAAVSVACFLIRKKILKKGE